MEIPVVERALGGVKFAAGGPPALALITGFKPMSTDRVVAASLHGVLIAGEDVQGRRSSRRSRPDFEHPHQQIMLASSRPSLIACMNSR
jgi:hypothetical protein